VTATTGEADFIVDIVRTWGAAVLRPYVKVQIGLIVTKRDERIDLSGSAGRQIAGGNGNCG
jgi:hypothetical protein